MSVQCKPGMYASGQLCYTNCSNPYDGKTYTGGFTGKTGVCWQNCTGETTDAGATCTKKSYENSAGVTTPQSCPSGKELYGGVCYNACPAGWSRSSLCGCSTKDGYSWGSVGCDGPKNNPTTFLGMTTGWNDCYTKYKTDINGTYCSGNTSPSCPSGYYSNGAGLCYKDCKPGYKGVASVCWATCPADMADFGVGCTKKSYVPAPVGGEMPYGSCNYPVSTVSSTTLYSPADTQDLAIGATYSGSASSGKGCVPNITGTQAGSGYGVATSKGFKWDSAEFDFALGGSCSLCSGCYGSECTGGFAITGARPSVKRKAYTGSVTNCCISGAKLDGAKTCDPKYRSTAAGRVADCGTDGMDVFCDNTINYSKTQFCKDNYTQIPAATKDLTAFNACSESCGGGTQTRTCRVNSATSGSVKALRKSILGKSFMLDREYLYEPVNTPNNTPNNTLDNTPENTPNNTPENTPNNTLDNTPENTLDNTPENTLDNTPENASKYYIYKDKCAGQPLQKECNTQNCVVHALETNRILQVFLFFIFVFVFGYFFIGQKKNVAGGINPPAYGYI